MARFLDESFTPFYLLFYLIIVHIYICIGLALFYLAETSIRFDLLQML